MHLYPHQQRVVEFMETHRGVLCLHSTGTGKSITSVATANRLVDLHLVTHIVALVKKSIVKQFTKEVENVNPNLVARFHVTTAETFLRVGNFPNPSKTFLIIDEAHAFSNPQGVTTQRLHAYAVQCHRVMLLTATPYANSLYDIAPLLGMIRANPSSHKGSLTPFSTPALRPPPSKPGSRIASACTPLTRAKRTTTRSSPSTSFPYP